MKIEIPVALVGAEREPDYIPNNFDFQSDIENFDQESHETNWIFQIGNGDDVQLIAVPAPEGLEEDFQSSSSRLWKLTITPITEFIS